MKIKTYKFLESSRVICLDETMIDVRDISAIHTYAFDGKVYTVSIILKNKRYIGVSLDKEILEKLQQDFLAERERRVNAGNFIKNNTSVEKGMSKDCSKSESILAALVHSWFKIKI